MANLDKMLADALDSGMKALAGGPFECLEELSNVIADAINDGYTESEGSFSIDWRGAPLEIIVRMDKSED